MAEPNERTLPLGQACGALSKSMAKLETKGFVKGQEAGGGKGQGWHVVFQKWLCPSQVTKDSRSRASDVFLHGDKEAAC